MVPPNSHATNSDPSKQNQSILNTHSPSFPSINSGSDCIGSNSQATSRNESNLSIHPISSTGSHTTQQSFDGNWMRRMASFTAHSQELSSTKAKDSPSLTYATINDRVYLTKSSSSASTSRKSEVTVAKTNLASSSTSTQSNYTSVSTLTLVPHTLTYYRNFRAFDPIFTFIG